MRITDAHTHLGLDLLALDPLAREREIMRSAGLLPRNLGSIMGIHILALTGGPS
jgi:hypothetical protein